MSNSKKSGFRSALDFDIRQLAAAQQVIAAQQALLATIKTALPAEIADHLLHCVHSGNRLLIYVASANWASQIRFYHADILTKLAESGHRNIGSLQIRLSLPTRTQSDGKPPRLPSAENIRLLRSRIRDAENNDVLEKALLKLAATLDKRLNARH